MSAMTRKRDNSDVSKAPLETKAITLRPELELLRFYEELTAEANAIQLSRGLRANLTVQQVLLRQLRSLPRYQEWVAKKGK